MLIMNYDNGGESNSTMQITNVTFSDISASGSVDVAGTLLCSRYAPCQQLAVVRVTHATTPKAGWTCEYAHGTTSESNPAPSCLVPAMQ